MQELHVLELFVCFDDSIQPSNASLKDICYTVNDDVTDYNYDYGDITDDCDNIDDDIDDDYGEEYLFYPGP